MGWLTIYQILLLDFELELSWLRYWLWKLVVVVLWSEKFLHCC